MVPSRTHEPELGRVRLEGDEVHLLWGRDAVESLDALRGSLSDEEWRRGERFRRERDARAFLFRRAFLRRALAGTIGGEPRELVFIQNEFGKPFLARRDTNVRFSATSSQGLVLVALAVGRELGIDLEHEQGLGRGEELSTLAHRILTPGEGRTFESLSPEARPRALLRAWTRKEAVLKALGTGLSREPGTVEVGLAELAKPVEVGLAELAAPVEVGLAELGLPVEARTPTQTSWSGWGQAFDLEAPAGFLAALVVAARPGQRLRLRCDPACPGP